VLELLMEEKFLVPFLLRNLFVFPPPSCDRFGFFCEFFFFLVAMFAPLAAFFPFLTFLPGQQFAGISSCSPYLFFGLFLFSAGRFPFSSPMFGSPPFLPERNRFDVWSLDPESPFAPPPIPFCVPRTHTLKSLGERPHFFPPLLLVLVLSLSSCRHQKSFLSLFLIRF